MMNHERVQEILSGISTTPQLLMWVLVLRMKGQRANSKKHSDLYTDENPKGTIKGLGFAKVKDAMASVAKIKASGRSHAHKTQAAIKSYGAEALLKRNG